MQHQLTVSAAYTDEPIPLGNRIVLTTRISRDQQLQFKYVIAELDEVKVWIRALVDKAMRMVGTVEFEGSTRVVSETRQEMGYSYLSVPS